MRMRKTVRRSVALATVGACALLLVPAAPAHGAGGDGWLPDGGGLTPGAILKWLTGLWHGLLSLGAPGGDPVLKDGEPPPPDPGDPGGSGMVVVPDG